jgi:hypothetical protein
LVFRQGFKDDLRKQEAEFNLGEFARKAGISEDFVLTDIAKTGHITLMDFSQAYGALFVAFNKSLLVIQGKDLGLLLSKGELPDSFKSIITVRLNLLLTFSLKIKSVS